MLKNRKTKVVATFILTFLFLFLIHASADDVQQKDNGKKNELQQRIDFGNAYIMGQSIKSGAVYLLHRKKSDVDSMLKVRKDYREEIIEDFELEGTKMIPKETDE